MESAIKTNTNLLRGVILGASGAVGRVKNKKFKIFLKILIEKIKFTKKNKSKKKF